MVRLFLDVGREARVGPADIVGAIANEAGVPGKAIGAIDVYDSFTLVDVPAEFAAQVIEGMSKARIRNQKANVRVAAPHEIAEDKRRGQRSGGRFQEKNFKENYKKRERPDRRPKKKFSKR